MANPGKAAARAGTLPPPPLVAVAGWLVPGAGYWLIGERARALAVGVAIVGLFLGGILIGGVRVIQVPGYGENGGKLFVESVKEERNGVTYRVPKVREQSETRPNPNGIWIARDPGSLLRDVGNKPWSICQVLAGPLAIGGGAWSVSASRPAEQAEQAEQAGGEPRAAGVLSHSRVNEIAILYTAVAGMLNLLVIIDAASRAARGEAVHVSGTGLDRATAAAARNFRSSVGAA